MPAATLLQTSAAAVAFTWVDGIKIVLIPLVLFVLQRTFSRRDKTVDEQKAKKDAEAKEREKRIDNELKSLHESVGQFVDKEALGKRFEKVELAQATHEKRMEGFQVQAERLADEATRRLSAIESQMGEMGRFREDMAGVKAKVDALSEGIRDMNSKLDMLLQRQMK